MTFFGARLRMSFSIYCLTYKNPAKRERITNRFQQLGLGFQFVEGFDAENSQITPDNLDVLKQEDRWHRLAWSCMHGHLAIIEKFLQESNSDHLIACEDDIMLRRDFAHELPVIEAQFRKLKLDVLMLGYLTPDPVAQVSSRMPTASTPYSYHHYEFNIYGTQMYMLSRSHAEWLHQNYGAPSGWSQRVVQEGGTYNADWIITKTGRRALIYPMMAIEELGGGVGYNDHGQEHFHQLCHHNNYDPFVHV